MCKKIYIVSTVTHAAIKAVWFSKKDSTKSSNFFQAEDLVANFFPKKLLELDHFLKVSYMFILIYTYFIVLDLSQSIICK